MVISLVCTPGIAAADTLPTVSGPCGVVNFELLPDQNPVFGPCVLPGGGTIVYGAMASAGRNFFSNTISPLNLVGVTGTTTVSEPMMVISNPNWDPGVLSVPIGLSATGIVNIQVPGSSIDILVMGMFGGTTLVISKSYFASGPISEFMPGRAAPGGTAVLTALVTAHGGASIFLPGSADFVGAVPEPSTYALVATGLLGLGILSWRRRKES